MHVQNLARLSRICTLVFTGSVLSIGGAWGYANRETISTKAAELYKQNGLRPELWYFSAMGIDLNKQFESCARSAQFPECKTQFGTGLLNGQPIDWAALNQPMKINLNGLTSGGPSTSSKRSAKSSSALPFTAPAAQDYQTLAATQPVALADGTRIVLAPGSHLRVSGRHQDRLQLEGAAYFDVPHDPSRTLLIRVNGYAVHDIGTRFEVFGAGRELKVGVAEGNVIVALPGGRDAPVNAGQQLIVTGEPAVVEYASIAAEDVAGWRSGRLVFRNEPLSLVAGQIGPHAGTTVVVDPAIAGRRFSGVLAIGDGSQLVARLGEIMGLAVEPQGDAVHLSAMAAEQ